MPPINPVNPVNLPQPLVRSVSQKDRTRKVAIVSFSVTSIMGAAGSLNKPYIQFTNMIYGLGQVSLFNTDPNFGDIKSVGYVYRNGWGLNNDYINQNTIEMIQRLNRVIVYDNATASEANIESDKVPVFDVASASQTGLWIPGEVTIEGSQPFFGGPQDQIEVCAIDGPAGAENGYLTLRFYNFDVLPFHKTTFSQFVNQG